MAGAITLVAFLSVLIILTPLDHMNSPSFKKRWHCLSGRHEFFTYDSYFYKSFKRDLDRCRNCRVSLFKDGTAEVDEVHTRRTLKLGTGKRK